MLFSRVLDFNCHLFLYFMYNLLFTAWCMHNEFLTLSWIGRKHMSTRHRWSDVVLSNNFVALAELWSAWYPNWGVMSLKHHRRNQYWAFSVLLTSHLKARSGLYDALCTVSNQVKYFAGILVAKNVALELKEVCGKVCKGYCQSVLRSWTFTLEPI